MGVQIYYELYMPNASAYFQRSGDFPQVTDGGGEVQVEVSPSNIVAPTFPILASIAPVIAGNTRWDLGVKMMPVMVGDPHPTYTFTVSAEGKTTPGTPGTPATGDGFPRWLLWLGLAGAAGYGIYYFTR